MISKGVMDINGAAVKYDVKHFEEGSDWGIDGGKVSKLECKANGEVLLRYDRGWDIEPHTELGYKVYAMMMADFN